jgi:hypothetical protein
VGRKHRAHTARPIGVSADDDLVVAHAIKHRLPGSNWQAIDRQAEILDGRTATAAHGHLKRYPLVGVPDHSPLSG